MEDNQKPDLEESVNVTEAHGQLSRDAAAASREQKVSDGGKEPMSLWVFASCAVILLVAGLALGEAGTLFSYDDTVRKGYVRYKLDADSDAGPAPTPALKAYMAKGSKVYGKCIGCHAPDGKGGGAYPPLAGSDWVMGETEVLAMIVLNGLSGPSSTGKEWGIMPAQGIGMSATDLAAVMTYVRNSFGNSSGDVVTVEMAQNAIETSESRDNPGTPMDAQQLAAKHSQALSGEPIAPDQLLDPVSLEPVEGDAGAADDAAATPE